jgi:hypothetical protein
MGLEPSKHDKKSETKTTTLPKFQKIADSFKTFTQLEEGLKKCGLESSNIVVGFDFTKSNFTNGAKSRRGKSLHYLPQDEKERRTNPNPYLGAFEIIARTLEKFDDDHIIPAYIFGDSVTIDKTVRSLRADGEINCDGLNGVLSAYRVAAQNIIPLDENGNLKRAPSKDKFELSLLGPTCFAPMIYETIRIVQENNNSYHILIILTDGQVVNEQATAAAIVEASNYPISIVVVGVGDGPFSKMEEFDDLLTDRKFDNLQFVNYTEFYGTMRNLENPDLTFATKVMMEIPDQYQIIKSRRMLGLKLPQKFASAPEAASKFVGATENAFAPGGPKYDPPSYEQSKNL